MLTIEEKRKKVKEYLTNKGFYIGDGIKYGLDFLVYTESQDLVHSKYGLIIQDNMTYQQLVSHQRICNSNNKILVVAFVDENEPIKLMQVERFITSEKNLSE